MANIISKFYIGIVISFFISAFSGCAAKPETKASLKQTTAIAEVEGKLYWADCVEVPQDIEPILFPLENWNCLTDSSKNE